MTFTIPAALAWAIVAFMLSWIASPDVSKVAAVGLAVMYGATQLLMLGVPVPTLPFGTPSSWLRGRGPRAQIAIWGTTLGPGFATRNPYASMWVAVSALCMIEPASHASLVGAVAGGSHGLARSAGIALNIRRQATPFEVMAARIHWRFVDGAALLGVATILLSAELA